MQGETDAKATGFAPYIWAVGWYFRVTDSKQPPQAAALQNRIAAWVKIILGQLISVENRKFLL